MAGMEVVRQSLIEELGALDGLKGDDLKAEIERARAKVAIAKEVNSYVTNQIAVTKLVVQTRSAASTDVSRAIDGLIGPPKSQGQEAEG